LVREERRIGLMVVEGLDVAVEAAKAKELKKSFKEVVDG
jgi:hypothetical protein